MPLNAKRTILSGTRTNAFWNARTATHPLIRNKYHQRRTVKPEQYHHRDLPKGDAVGPQLHRETSRRPTAKGQRRTPTPDSIRRTFQNPQSLLKRWETWRLSFFGSRQNCVLKNSDHRSSYAADEMRKNTTRGLIKLRQVETTLCYSVDALASTRIRSRPRTCSPERAPCSHLAKHKVTRRTQTTIFPCFLKFKDQSLAAPLTPCHPENPRTLQSLRKKTSSHF